QVARTVFAARPRAYRNVAIDPSTRRTADLFLYQQDKKGKQVPEINEDIVMHLLQFAFRPVLIWEHPVDLAGEIIKSQNLQDLIARKVKNWDEEVVFPNLTCEVARLRFTDMIGLEMLRRHQHQTRCGITFLGAELTPDTLDIIREVWPNVIH